MEPAKSKTQKPKLKRGDEMTDELLHGAGSAHAHVQESWAPVVIDDRTLADWAKLPQEPTPCESGSDEQQPDA